MLLPVLRPILDLMYPPVCLACQQELPASAEMLCLHCWYELPETHQHVCLENAFAEIFWGRVPIVAGAALYYFSKSGRVQRLIHQLKYERKSVIGIELGTYYGSQLRQVAPFNTTQVVVPVPLHPKKEKDRGYNQANVFGEGMAKSLGVPVCCEVLKKNEHTLSQTQKSRLGRMQNVQQSFRLGNPEDVKGKHVLLVDDVLTTGATLEACASLLMEVEGVSVSLATIAMAGD